MVFVLLGIVVIVLIIWLIKNRNTVKQGENGSAKAASSMGIIAKISWGVISIGCAAGGGIVGSGIDSGAGTLIGALIGLAAGALVGFFVNLVLLYFAELGQNTAKTAANSGGHSSASTADEIQKYKEMLDNGTITQQEFEDLKRNLIQK